MLEVARYREAIEELTWVLDADVCDRYASELYLGRARAHLALGNAEAAVSDCGEAIDRDYHEQAHWPFIVRFRFGHAHEAYLVRAEAHLSLGHTPAALGDCYFAATIAPAEPSVYDLRARVLYAVGNLQEAILDTIRADHLRGGVARRTPGVQEDSAVLLATGI